MTAREMQKAFETKVTLIDSSLLIDEKLTSDTIFQFLNAYTKRFVKQIYLGKDNIADDTRAHKYNLDVIKSLVSRKYLQPNNNIFITDPNTKQYILPDDYFLYLRSNSLVESTYLDNESGKIHVIPNDLVAVEDTEKIITTPYNQIILRQPQVILCSNDNQNCMNVIYDKFTKPTDIDLIYYRMPKEFNVIGVDDNKILDHCELPESVHEDIVTGAVEMFITEARYRLTTKQQDNNEIR